MDIFLFPSIDTNEKKWKIKYLFHKKKKGKRNDNNTGCRKRRRGRLIFTTGRLFKSSQFEMRDICLSLLNYHRVLYSERTPMFSPHVVERRKKKWNECISIWILYFILQNRCFVILFKVLKPLNWRQSDPSLPQNRKDETSKI